MIPISTVPASHLFFERNRKHIANSRTECTTTCPRALLPIRSVTDDEYRFIRNLTPDELYIEKHLMGHVGNGALNNPYWATWIRQADRSADAYDLVNRYMLRPTEQLYHTSQDICELADLARDDFCAAMKQRLSATLDQ